MIRDKHGLFLSEEEFDRLTNGTVEHSISTFAKLTGFASGSACLPSQYLHVMSLMYKQLSASRIPRGTIGEDFPAEHLNLVFASFVGLGVTIPIWLSHKDFWQSLAKGLSAHWPDIRRWVLYLYRNVIIKENVDIDVRYTCKTAVLDFLGLVRDRLLVSWSKTITTDREIMRVICDLWFIETRDPRFSSRTTDGNTQRESAVFNSCFLVAYEMGCAIDWDNLLSLFDGDPGLIATVSLCHLDHEISHSDELDLNCVAWDLHIITTFSFHEDIRLALLHQGMIKAASEILQYIVDRTWTGERRVLAARCMTNALALLRVRIEDLDASPFLIQALERGLVQSLLKSEVLLPFAEQLPAHHEPIVLFDILVGYTVYRTILYPMVLAVDSVIAQRLETRLARDGMIYKAWKRLKDVVDERRRLTRHDVANWHIQSCQNADASHILSHPDAMLTCYRMQCSKARHMSRFKRCGGCLHAYYCSRECQRYDWRNGKHKEYCTRIHQRFVRTNKQMSAVRSKDLRFLDQVILAELRKHRARLGTHPSKLTLVDLNLMGVQANVIFDARGANANPFGTRCRCEVFSNMRWKHMAEVVREGKRPMVLVRAFIRGGLSRKIVLQAIPLSVVVEGGQGERQNDQEMDKYQFNLIFTCCGSEGSCSKEPEVLKEQRSPRGPKGRERV